MHRYVHCVTVYNRSSRKDIEPTQMPIDYTLDKEYMAHIHEEYYAAIKNNEFMFFAGTWMNLETIIFRKLTQEQKSKHHMLSLIDGC